MYEYVAKKTNIVYFSEKKDENLVQDQETEAEKDLVLVNENEDILGLKIGRNVPDQGKDEDLERTGKGDPGREKIVGGLDPER